MNSYLIRAFDILANHTTLYKAQAHLNTKDSLKQLKYEITKATLSQLQEDIAAKKVTGIGAGNMKRIEEYLSTAKISEAEHFASQVELSKILGVGAATIEEWAKLGIFSLDDLRKSKVKLTRMQKYGLRYFDDLQQKLTRVDVEAVVAQIRKYCACEIVGSYRRGAEFSNDIDLLITSIPQLSVDPNYVDTILAGETRSTILWKYQSRVVQVDLLIATGNYFAALNYFTGSRTHNIMLRHTAKFAGMRLNQNGLFKVYSNGTLVEIPLHHERDIYTKLGLRYVEPKNR